MTDETNTQTAAQTTAPEIDLAAALSASQEAVLDLQAQNIVLNDQRESAESTAANLTAQLSAVQAQLSAVQAQLSAVQAQLASATVTQLSDADKLVAAYALVDADKLAKKTAYDAEQAAALAEHQAELDFIKSCTPQQVSQAGLVIGPLTTHKMIYERLKAVVGNG